MLNDNWDKIDEAVGQVREELENVDVDIPNASLTEKGIVQLSNATNGTREDVAATEKAVKAAYDEALAGKQLGVEQKANVVAALNSIGVAASTSETWAQLVAKMAGVIRATGNATPGDVLAGKTFSNASGNGLTGGMPNYSRSVLREEYKSAISAKGDGVGNLVVEPSTGFYEQGKNSRGYGSIIIGDPAFVPSNIRSGYSIFGVQGTLVPLTTEKKVVNGSENYSLRGNAGRAPLVFNRVDFRPSKILLLFSVFVSSYSDGSEGIYVPYFLEITSNRSYEFSDMSSRYNFTVNLTDYGFSIQSTFYTGRPEFNRSDFRLTGWYMIS
ncbi:hypothetical protein GNP94_11075 [Paenibacillus campinasensis]|uniref:Uncharacterized protein n=2 Tax=Paenibacillus TaxID=44249 RepID=A0ABW9T4H2_9BACL|nr:hypothetical protein [Paenibacillus campinasensis]